MFVKIAQLGEKVQEVYLENGATVEDALAAADVDATNFNIRVNRVEANEDTVLPDTGDTAVVVTLLPAVKGGSR